MSAASRAALHELLGLIAKADRDYVGELGGPSGIRFLLHLLGGGLDLALEADPLRPEFRPTMSAGRRFYGDNPDAIYQSTTIDPAFAYHIRANLQGAVYTSYSVEGGGGLDERYPPGRVVSSLNDTRFEADPDGTYTLIASVERPAAGAPWLPLAPDACSIVTRHYFEGDAPVDRRLSIPISIEVIGARRAGSNSAVAQTSSPAPSDDVALARGIRRVANFVRGLSLDYGKNGPVIDFASREPNRFAPPSGWSGEAGQGPVDQSNVWAPFVLADDEALVIEGRFPRCRFANLVVWNRHLQSLGRPGTRSSLNRRQTRLESDGRFRLVVAATDPGLPNWLDTGGEREGIVFVRYLLPEEWPEGLVTRVVRVGER